MARASSDDDDPIGWNQPTEPHRAVDPEARLALHGELTGDDLVAAVFADPASDAPRLVYGDYLLERGDPRGELIQLQLQRHATGAPPGEREVVLLDANVQAWTEPLWSGLDASSIRFERGFLTACRTIGTLALRDVVGHPMWSTVEYLESDELALVVNPCMRSMRRLRTRVEQVARLAHVAHPVLVERLEVFPNYSAGRGWHGYIQEKWNDVFKVGALTAVRELGLELDAGATPNDPMLTQLFASRLGGQLQRVELWTNDVHALSVWERTVREHPSIRSIGCSVYRRQHDREHHGIVLLERGDDGRTGVVLELESARVPSDATLHVLQSFAPTAHRSLVIRYRPGDPEVDDAALEAIRRRVTPTFHEVTATQLTKR